MDPSIPCIVLKKCRTTSIETVLFAELFSKLSFTHYFQSSARYAVYYGPVDYKYSSTTHPAQQIPSGSIIHEVFGNITALFPALGLNSVLINYYPNSNSSMPYHSDNESIIAEFSWIVIISLGSTRIISFQDRELGTEYSVQLEHGDILCMSKCSQARIRHSVRDLVLPDFLFGNSPIRVSLTFRRMEAEV